MHAALIAAILFAAEPLAVVEQEVECVSICHLEDSQVLLFFFDTIQGQWTQLAHRWACCTMAITWTGTRWQVEWDDEETGLHRVVTTGCWVETWQADNPLQADHNAPWFRRLLEPGLREAPRLAQHQAN